MENKRQSFKMSQNYANFENAMIDLQQRGKKTTKMLTLLSRLLQWRTLGGGARGAVAPQIFWKTKVFCSKIIEICDVIFSKQ